MQFCGDKFLMMKSMQYFMRPCTPKKSEIICISTTFDSLIALTSRRYANLIISSIVVDETPIMKVSNLFCVSGVVKSVLRSKLTFYGIFFEKTFLPEVITASAHDCPMHVENFSTVSSDSSIAKLIVYTHLVELDHRFVADTLLWHFIFVTVAWDDFF